jgi:predicted CopG family antitoxin
LCLGEKASLVEMRPFWQIWYVQTKTVELESDAFTKLEAAKWTENESLSAVVRRAEFPVKPRCARELMDEFARRAGHSPLSEDALDQLAKAQNNPHVSASHR